MSDIEALVPVDYEDIMDELNDEELELEVGLELNSDYDTWLERSNDIESFLNGDDVPY